MANNTTNKNGWTMDTLKEYLEQIAVAGDEALRQHIDSQKESIKTALESLRLSLSERDKYIDRADERAREAITKADSQLAARLETMNEFRNQITKERGEYITRDLHDSDMTQVNSLADRNRDELGKRVSREVFDSTFKEWADWRTDLNAWRAGLRGMGEGISSTGKVVMATLTALSLMMGIIAIFIGLSTRLGDNKPIITNPAVTSLVAPAVTPKPQ